MSNIAFASKKSGHEARGVNLAGNGVSMLRTEMELIIQDDIYLKRIAGAAVILMARLDKVSLPGGTAKAAFALAGLIEGMPADMTSEVMCPIKLL